ncbi:hypothetical protein ABIE45_000970 [Methylobacterium sp. OAE515]|uniref:AlbA family DNA-binding domain-containing protein n=1 Tax=Methylobacterium sp. OAE515 TaxID=2817895 RepID=UPI00178BCCEA
MPIDSSVAQQLVDHPSESLSTELKRWIYPDELEGSAKIVKACLGLRNRDGGYLVIGIDDKSHQVDRPSRTFKTEDMFHIDIIQTLIGRYASQPFEIEIAYPVRDGQTLVIIRVPPGVRVPVAAKRDLEDATKIKLIKNGDVYFRTLRSNMTVSTAAAQATDWSDIIEICLENREADLGRFVRRHVAAGLADPSQLGALRSAFSPQVSPPTLIEQSKKFLDAGYDRFQERLRLGGLGETAVRHALGGWEVACVTSPPLSGYNADENFYSLLMSNNPQLSGWPIWMDTRGFEDKADRPKVFAGGWEVVISEPLLWDHLDFMRFEPTGRYYLWRAHDDDASARAREAIPGKFFDPGLMARRVAEALIAGLSFAKLSEHILPDVELALSFRWTGLRHRSLSAWGSSIAMFGPSRYVAEDDAVDATITISGDTPYSALAPYITNVMAQVVSVFNGYTFKEVFSENALKRVLSRES